MDVKMVNPFIDAVFDVMPQLGFQKAERVGLKVKDSNLANDGVMVLIGITGAVKGNVVYNLDMEDAKKTASTMMMGMPVAELDDMAQSAISELGNMLAANASIKIANAGIEMHISPPTLLYGREASLKVPVEKVLAVDMLVDSIPLEINIALD